MPFVTIIFYMFIIDIFKIKVHFWQYRNYKSDSNLCKQVIMSKGSVKGEGGGRKGKRKWCNYFITSENKVR